MHTVELAEEVAPAAPRLVCAPWWEMTLHLDATLSEDAGALLIDAGAMGAQTFSVQAFAERDWQRHASMGPRKVVEPRAPSDVDACVLIASFTGDATQAEVSALVQETLRGIVPQASLQTLTVSCRNDAAWAHAWREHYKPLKLGRSLWIVPRWDTRFLPPMGSTVVRIDPGMAFGTGQHATTSLCLKAIERRVLAARAAGVPLRVLDVGAGSGILAIAALALGAQHATLTDIDPEALAACQSNVEVAGQTARACVQADLPAAGASFGLVVANILAHTLIDMMPQLLAQVAEHGTLLLSGILAEQSDDVSRAVHSASKKAGRRTPLVRRLQHDKWVALVYGAPLDAAL